MRVCAFGEIAFAVIPKRASSFAAVFVKPMIPALAMVLLDWPGLPCRPV